MDEVEHRDGIAKRSDVAVLYCDPKGIYPTLVEHWWDEKRDARTYNLTLPIVAHPPCGPWSKFRHMYKGAEHDLAPAAIKQVRLYGGVLEHPAQSKLWQHLDLPLPGQFPDTYGGITVSVDQLHWGHVAHKRTWIYAVGCDEERLYLPYPPFPNRKPTHDLMGGRGRNAQVQRGARLEASKELRRRTPVAFAEWLLELAATAGKVRAA